MVYPDRHLMQSRFIYVCFKILDFSWSYIFLIHNSSQIFFMCVCVCGVGCACVLWGWVPMHMPRGQRRTSRVLLYHLHFIWVTSVSQSGTSWQLATPQQTSILCPQLHWGYRYRLDFLHECWDLGLGSHSCTLKHPYPLNHLSSLQITFFSPSCICVLEALLMRVHWK